MQYIMVQRIQYRKKGKIIYKLKGRGFNEEKLKRNTNKVVPVRLQERQGSFQKKKIQFNNFKAKFLKKFFKKE